MALCPRKYLIRDLLHKPTPLEVWLQGTIEQTVGTDIMILSDTFGRSKITKCESADGIIDKKSFKKGSSFPPAIQMDVFGYVKKLTVFEYMTKLKEKLSQLSSFKSLQVIVRRIGTYCCIIGTAVKTKGLPEVQATKFIDLSSQPHMKTAWETEVKESELFLQGKIQPSL